MRHLPGQRSTSTGAQRAPVFGVVAFIQDDELRLDGKQEVQPARSNPAIGLSPYHSWGKDVIVKDE
jgi:hypothetical protein